MPSLVPGLRRPPSSALSQSAASFRVGIDDEALSRGCARLPCNRRSNICLSFVVPGFVWVLRREPWSPRAFHPGAVVIHAAVTDLTRPSRQELYILHKLPQDSSIRWPACRLQGEQPDPGYPGVFPPESVNLPEMLVGIGIPSFLRSTQDNVGKVRMLKRWVFPRDEAFPSS